MNDRLLALPTIFVLAIAAVATAIATAVASSAEPPPLDLPAASAPAPAAAEAPAILRFAVVGYALFGMEEAILGAVDVPVRPGVPFRARIDFARPLPPEFGTQAVTGTISGEWYGAREGVALARVNPRLSYSAKGAGWSSMHATPFGLSSAGRVLRPGLPTILPPFGTPILAAVLLTPEQAAAVPAGERAAWIDLARRGAESPAVPDRPAVRSAARALGRDGDTFVDGGPLVHALLAAYAFGDAALVSDLRERFRADGDLFPEIARAYGANPRMAREMQLAARLLGAPALAALEGPAFAPPLGPISIGGGPELATPAFQWFGMPPLRVLRFTTEREEIEGVEALLRRGVAPWFLTTAISSLTLEDPLKNPRSLLPRYVIAHEPPTEAAAPIWEGCREQLIGSLPPGVGVALRHPLTFAVALAFAALLAAGVALLPGGTRRRRLPWPLFVLLAAGAMVLWFLLPDRLGGVVLVLAVWHIAIVWMRSSAPHPPWERVAVAAGLISVTVFGALGVSAASVHPALGPASLAGFFLAWPVAARASGRREGDPGTGALRIFLFLVAALSLALLPGFREHLLTPPLLAAAGFALLLTLLPRRKLKHR